MSLHIASFNTGKVLGSVLTTAFGVTSTNFANLAPLVLVSHFHQGACGMMAYTSVADKAMSGVMYVARPQRNT